ncbi:MAG: branched-chain amino acid aminotransferase [Candidatus Ozemobacteraceae bacterium]
MQIAVAPFLENERQPLVDEPKNLGFCKVFTDRMFTMRYSEAEGWHNAEISRRRPFSMEPSSMVFHYAQEIFEGLKAFRSPKGDVRLFRPEMNARRFRKSAARLCMPPLPEEIFLESIESLVKVEERWVPRSPEASLYIRPFMIASEAALGVRASSDYFYCVILSPVGPYFPGGFFPISLYISSEYSRAAKGGVGDAKTGGNYAASLLAGRIARENGCSQVLWLDSAEHRYVEEAGAMNAFFVLNDRLITPRLNGSILAGVVRDSVIHLGRELEILVAERDIALTEILEGTENGQLSEMFLCGTAATISPVGSLKYQEREYVINQRKVGPVAKNLLGKLNGIQRGEARDSFGWVRIIHPEGGDA